jgi:hypothetical protein
VKLTLLWAAAALATSVSSARAQEGDGYQTWYDGDSGLPFRVYRDNPGSNHWQGWDENQAVSMIVHGSWWNKWAEGTIGAYHAECYPDWLLRMYCQ